MKTVMLDNIIVMYADDMSDYEAVYYAKKERDIWQAQGKKISTITIDIDGEEVVISAKEKSKLTRIRRISGYLSSTVNWNDAKVHELADRESHMKGMR